MLALHIQDSYFLIMWLPPYVHTTYTAFSTIVAPQLNLSDNRGRREISYILQATILTSYMCMKWVLYFVKFVYIGSLNAMLQSFPHWVAKLYVNVFYTSVIYFVKVLYIGWLNVILQRYPHWVVKLYVNLTYKCTCHVSVTYALQFNKTL